MNKRERRIFSDSFKQQMFQVYLNGKSCADIIREYDLTPSAFNRGINQRKTTGAFKEKDNLSDKVRELRVLQKHVQQLELESDILKQVALIMGRK